jgi:methanethiol S-methyltransferase
MSRTTYLVLAIAARVLTDLPLLGMFVLIHFGWRGDGDGKDAAWNAGAFAAWAVLHSLFARDAARRVLSRGVGPDFVRIAYVIVAGVTLALLLLVWHPGEWSS